MAETLKVEHQIEWFNRSEKWSHVNSFVGPEGLSEARDRIKELRKLWPDRKYRMRRIKTVEKTLWKE